MILISSLHVGIMSPYTSQVHVEQIGGARHVQRTRRYAECGIVGCLNVAVARGSDDEEHAVGAETAVGVGHQSAQLAVNAQISVLQLHLTVCHALLSKRSGIVGETQQVCHHVIAYACAVDTVTGHFGNVGVDQCAFLVAVKAIIACEFVVEGLVAAAIEIIVVRPGHVVERFPLGVTDFACRGFCLVVRTDPRGQQLCVVG